MTDTPVRTTEVPALVAALGDARVCGTLPTVVTGIAHDSRAVAPGYAFLALRGERADGHAFLAAAAAAGATVAIVDETFAGSNALPATLATVVVPDTRRALSRLSAAFYGYPSRSLRITGVTGTNGKTTTTHLIAAVCAAAGIAAGRIGTLGASFGDATWPLENTTPLALETMALLAEMRDRGGRAVAMEVSSHALSLDRVADIEFDIGVLTNITRDHLDFHPTFEAYAAAKKTLFDRTRVAILGLDDAQGARWAAEFAAAGRRVVTYGLGPAADVRATGLSLGADGSAFSVDGIRFTLRLPARFNVENALAALCVAREYGIADALTAGALAAFDRVPGRMEHFSGDGVDVLVDYAHTPAALEAVLRAARETARRDVAVVFGCGGDRDSGKRPQMGALALALADRTFVTSDNPRSEDPLRIIDEILAGMNSHEYVDVEADRRVAIRRAILEALPGDIVVVAGKGHEDYQIVGTTASHFDDRDEVRAALAARALAQRA
jgi:UDP-N-acetylmuramoyl-L-alanyl-D-glutamate--2,6-diaminopimelate ligase